MQTTNMFPSPRTSTCSNSQNLIEIPNKIPPNNNNYHVNNHSKITCKLLINPSKNANTIIITSPSSPKHKPFPSNPQPPPLPPPVSPISPPTYNPSNLNTLQRLAATTLDIFEKSCIMDQENKHPLPKTINPEIQLSGNYAPVQEAPVQTGLKIIGNIPVGLHGIYVRNGANPKIPPSGAHHLFDGDGMIHAVKLGPGNKASYCCRFTQTNRLVQETRLGKNVFPKPIGELHGRTGLLRLGLFYARAAIGLVDQTRGIGVANAGLVYFNGRLLAMSEDDLPYHIKVINDINNQDDHGLDGVDLSTIRRFDFDGQVNCPLIAHPKVDPVTGDLHTLSYNVVRKPYLKYLRFDKWGRKSHEVPVPLPQPTMIHDFAITQNFVVIPDGQVVFELSKMIRDESPLRFNPNKVARFGVLSKDDTNGSGIRWVNVPNSFCFHFVNAWEETKSNGGKIINIIGSCMSPPDSIFDDKDIEEPIRIELCEIRLDPETGESTRRVIVSGLNLEMGQVNKHMVGKKTRYIYLAIAEPWPKCGGIAKVDLETGSVLKFMYGDEKFGGEPCFVPAKKLASTVNCGDDELSDYIDNGSEDEGWILNFVRDEVGETSELVILSGKDMKQVASVCIPSRVPYGFHGTFIDQDQLLVQTNN